MSDAQLPSDIGGREGEPSRRSGLRLDENGTMTSDHAAGSSAQQRADATASLDGDASRGRSNAFPSDYSSAPPRPAEDDDLQPMLDLGFPEEPLRPATQTPPAEAPGSALHETDVLSAPFPPEEPGPGDSDVERTVPLESSDPIPMGHSDPVEDAAPDNPSEISPIFSALDAADRAAAEAAHQRAPVAEVDAFEVGILLPGPQPSASERDDPSAHAIEASEPLTALAPVAGTEEEHDPGLAGETAIAFEAAAQDGDAGEQSPVDEAPRPADRLHDAAARIAAEASATAAALENLKRLLVDKLPTPDIVPASEISTTAATDDEPERQGDDSPQRAEPPPIPSYHAPVHLPVTPPPMIAGAMASAALAYPADDLPRRRSGAAVGSFLVGFTLSWVFGAVLYVFLISG